MVVLAVHLEIKQQGTEFVLLDRVHDKTNNLFSSLKMTGLASA